METIKKALQLLKAIGETPLSVTDIARNFSLHKSSASRILSTLRDEGFIVMNSARKYELGPLVFTLTSSMTENQRLKSIAAPFLKILNENTDETVHLAVLTGTNVVYIDKIDSSRMVRIASRIGFLTPSYCSGIGKALLAFQKPNDMDHLINSIRFERFTKSTIVDRDELKQVLLEVRKTGFAYDIGEHDENINCIAVPLFDHSGKVVASISISAPEFYTDEAKLRSYQEIIMDCAVRISKNLGYEGSIPP